MRAERIALRHAPAGTAIALRELRGRDELAVEGIDTQAAVELLDRAMAREDIPAAGLCAADRDTLLAALHRREWGDRIVTTLTCEGCGERFDLSFALSEVQAYLARAVSGVAVMAPTAEQELRAATCGARAGVLALAEQLGVDASELESMAATLEAEAPILDLEIGAKCTECGHAQEVHFDVQSFVLQRLLGERALLLSEIHLMASDYGWSLREILALPRSVRRAMTRTLDEWRGPWR